MKDLPVYIIALTLMVVAPVALVLGLPACTQQPAPKAEFKKPAISKQSAWDDHLEYVGFAATALVEQGQELMKAKPSDLFLWCSGQCQAPEELYLELFGRLIAYESSFNPKNVFTEADGNRSVGLLQLSMSDAAIYGCDFKKEADIMDPQKNLRCGVKIMQRLVLKDGVISGGDGSPARPWRGAARYWSQFRKPDRVSAMKLATLGATL